MGTTDTSQTNNQSTASPEALAAIAQLLQVSQQNQPAMSMTNGQTGNAQGQQINQTNPVTGLNDNHAQILQGVIDKQTKQHAQDFVNTYGAQTAQNLLNAHQATSQPPMSTPQGVNPAGAQMLQQSQQTSNPQQVLQGLVGKGQSQTPFNSNNAMQTLQQQAMQIEQQKPGLLGTLFPGMFEVNKSQKLNNTEAAMNIAAGKPAEIAKTQAETGETQSRVAFNAQETALLKQRRNEGGPPTSPAEELDYQSKLNEQKVSLVSNKISATQDVVDKQAVALEEFMKQAPILIKANPISFTSKFNELYGNLKDSVKTLGDTANAINDIKFYTPPKRNQGGSQQNKITAEIKAKAPAGATHYDPPSGKYYDAKGNEVK